MRRAGGGGGDNIPAVALEQTRCSGLKQAPEVVLISKDINLRIKSDAVGLQSEDYVNDNVTIDDLYTGFRELSTDAETIKTLHDEDQLPLEAVADPEGQHLQANEGVVLVDHGARVGGRIIRSGGCNMELDERIHL